MPERKRQPLPRSWLLVALALVVFNFVVAFLIASGTLEAWLGRG